ncbi:MAG: hypothetical protein HZT40_01325 [Candidatus Thiothrix singaporensis]|uniref:Uncharacterized protein n=1 Tax=Candidatus Thiothrix singaporensis TaxID=2799669 RepID=A0A7L6AN68_9GAMM|nr:MAG: hypothetical protein HZT40_01325 [Candidatus Thiothrix singaporensis]
MMDKSAVWVSALLSLSLVGCSVFEQSVKPSVGSSVSRGEASENNKPIAPENPASGQASHRGAAPKTPDEFFTNWIKLDGNKTKLQDWLNKNPKAPKDINAFLSAKRYQDLRYEAYFDLVGSK